MSDHGTSESQGVIVMYALELLMERAWAADDRRAFAIVDEASTLYGYAPGVIAEMAVPGHHEDAFRYREEARKRRHTALLRARARGLLHALTELADAGVLAGRDCAEERRQMWLARGGHDAQIEPKVLA